MDYNIDWLSFMLPYEKGVRFLQRFLLDVVELDHGGRGYTRSGVICGTGRVFWHPGRPEMGYHFMLPASALSAWVGDFEKRKPGRKWGPLQIVARVLSWGGHFSRLDVAFDDKIGLFNVADLIEAAKSGRIVSRWRDFRVFDGGSLVDGVQNNLGITFGSRSSDAFLRVYDKKLEQFSKGVEGLPEHWVRVEVEFKSDRAQAVAGLLASRVDGATREIAGILYGYIDVKEVNGGDSNRHRWQTASFWHEFLGWVGKAKLIVAARARGLTEVVEWLQQQVAPSLAVAVEALGDDIVDLLVGNGKRRWSARHLAMLPVR